MNQHSPVPREIIQIASLILQAKNAVVLTGSGLNIAAGLPDMESNLSSSSSISGTRHRLSIRREQASPTFAFMAIAQLFNYKRIKNVITTIVEGLHQRSGVPQENVFEVYGNCFTETCPACGTIFYRDYDVTSAKSQSLFLPEKTEQELIAQQVNINFASYSQQSQSAQQRKDSVLLNKAENHLTG
ncbi:MAG: hypothetical protein EZS28_051607, partial [Streblomastix strix]